MLKLYLILLISSLTLISCGQNNETIDMTNFSNNSDSNKMIKTDKEWKEQLTPMQFFVTRQSGTERAFTGELTDEFSPGTYYCVCCNEELFKSHTKFHSGCGWPSFYDKSKPNNIKEVLDKSHGMVRTEVRCSKCDAHLGHVFNDGPEPTGLRYCINSAALKFVEE